MPGASVRTCSPERRAIRWITRIVYVSSSFGPRTTSSTIEIAEMTSAATSADPNPVIAIESVSASAASSTSASNTRTSRNVVAIVYGRRSAAMTGATPR